MGASGNLCASVYVSIDENAEATGLWPQMSHPTDPWALQGPRRGHELRSLIFESFEFWNVGNVMFTVSSGINFQRISIFSGWAHLGYARIVEGGTLSGSLLSSLVLENHCFWEKNLFFSGCHQLQEEYCNSFSFFLFFFLLSFLFFFFCIFILFMGFSSQEYWSGLPFSSSVNHVLSDSVDMSLSKLQEMMKDRNLECCNSWGCKKLDTT